MDIFLKSEKTISRNNLALLCLPLVTSNGKTSRVNRPKGNDLKFLCEYNYKDAALDRFVEICGKRNKMKKHILCVIILMAIPNRCGLLIAATKVK
jgi:hypothetical protein